MIQKKQNDSKKADFTQKLMIWNQKSNSRQMPWKGEKDPYKIWLSEIILQQTRVEQGRSYYEAFIKTFPTVEKLAGAPENRVFKLWEGLGYYTRCKNLIKTARVIAKEYNGKFPSLYEDILSLSGIGPYTAAAIASFAYNLPYAVVDGNVFRVLSRYFGIDIPVDGKEGKLFYTQLANELLDKKNPGVYNQAIMDLGAVVCKPQQPLCNQCPQKLSCRAFHEGRVESLPVKEKKITIRTRWFYYFIISINNDVFIRKRTEKDIWENLFEFYLIENKTALKNNIDAITTIVKNRFGKKQIEIKSISEVFSQKLSHQLIKGQFIELIFSQKPSIGNGYLLINRNKLDKYPFPQFINSYLNQSVKKKR